MCVKETDKQKKTKKREKDFKQKEEFVLLLWLDMFVNLIKLIVFLNCYSDATEDG